MGGALAASTAQAIATPLDPNPNPNPNLPLTLTPTPTPTLAVALTLTLAAQAIATPLDVARVRIMTSDATDVVGTMKDIAANEGAGALYAGIAPKVARALASGAIQFSTYEATKDWAVGYLARTFPRL